MSGSSRRRPSIYTAAPLPEKRHAERMTNARMKTSNGLRTNQFSANVPNTWTPLQRDAHALPTTNVCNAVDSKPSLQARALKPPQATLVNRAVTVKASCSKKSNETELQLNGTKVSLAVQEKKSDLLEVKTPECIKRSACPNFLISTQIKKVCVDVVPEDISPLKVQKNVNCTYNMDQNIESPLIKSTPVNKIADHEGGMCVIKTPTSIEGAPSNYLSPFVSVSRGKVSRQKESNRRSSFYLELKDILPSCTKKNVQPEEIKSAGAVEQNRATRHTLESVRYHRNQLNCQIERLHALCDNWESYKCEHLPQLIEKGCDDMIDAAIGQTRLLTSKKFMQFKGLIDRCEAYATGAEVPRDDEGESKRLITSVDLEGFWSMLSIQVDNLDERFAKLDAWKNNDWYDPEAVRQKPEGAKKRNQPVWEAQKNKVAMGKATEARGRQKGGSCSQFIQMMRRKQAEKRKQMAVDSCAQESEGYMTPPREKCNRSSATNSIRRTVLVKDRKMFSPSPTVLILSKSIKRKSCEKSLQVPPAEVAAMPPGPDDTCNLSAGRSGATTDEKEPRVSLFPVVQTPTASSGRKSILKTPGSIRSRLKNVVFMERQRVQQFNFFESENEGDNAGD